MAAVPEPLRKRFWKAIGREDIPQDPRFATPKAVRANKQAFNDEITRSLQAHTALEWEGILNKAGVAAMAVRQLEDAVTQEQLQHRQFFHPFEAEADTGRGMRGRGQRWQQQAPQRYVIGYAGEADRAEIDGVKLAQLVEPVLGHHLAGLGVALARPVEGFKLQVDVEFTRGLFQHPHALRYNFMSDAVARDHGNAMGFLAGHVLRP